MSFTVKSITLWEMCSQMFKHVSNMYEIAEQVLRIISFNCEKLSKGFS